MEKIKVAIITVNYQGLTDTLNLLDSIKVAKISPSLSVTTFVVDNNSTDNSVEIIKKKHPDIRLVANKNNLGFSGGNNAAIRVALAEKYDWLVMLNNDCLVKDNFFINLNKSAISDNKVGAVGGLIYFAPGFEFKKNYKKEESGKVIWYAGGQFDWLNVLGSHRLVDQVDTGSLTLMETDFVSGALLITRAEVLKKVGLFDERYFMYLEDVELCQRIKLAGYKIIFDPSIKTWHKVAQSSGIGSSLNDYFITRNRLLFGFKYAALRTKIALVRQAINKIFTGTKAQKTAVIDFFLGNFGKGNWLK